jgi:hypothetical protein
MHIIVINLHNLGHYNPINQFLQRFWFQNLFIEFPTNQYKVENY